MFIIKNKDEAIGYYTGYDWLPDATKAKRYATKDEAEAVITKHNMAALAVAAE